MNDGLLKGNGELGNINREIGVPYMRLSTDIRQGDVATRCATLATSHNNPLETNSRIFRVSGRFKNQMKSNASETQSQ
jgi:hypothetical protein